MVYICNLTYEVISGNMRYKEYQPRDAGGTRTPLSTLHNYEMATVGFQAQQQIP